MRAEAGYACKALIELVAGRAKGHLLVAVD